MERSKLIRIVLGLLLVIALGVGGIYRSRNARIEHPACRGETMGTTYSIRITGRVREERLNRLTERIEETLREVNRQMSTWDAQSEISRFNHAQTTEPLPVSAGFADVVARALELSRLSGGAFDPTLQPLLNLWGFGSEGMADAPLPSDADIAACKAITGLDKIRVLPSPALQKTEPGVSLALGGIAKGYGVDAVAALLAEEDVEGWFVEIGGEVVVSGLNPSGVPWRIGIQYPSVDPGETRLEGILHITGGAVATSGDYRNYREDGGVIYSHILDPRSGRAVRSGTASVTVYAPDCTLADGMATALFVMGVQEGLEWVERTPGVEALYLIRRDGSIIGKFSSGFLDATGYIASSHSEDALSGLKNEDKD